MNSKYTVGIETITPQKARALLEMFPRNRSSAPHRIDSYVGIINRGDWAPFSSIIIDEDGETVDGHHRLEAIVKSGLSVDMVVFRGLDKKYIPFIDTGRSRSAGDMLAFIEGIDGGMAFNNVAALSKAILYYRAKHYGIVVPPDELANFVLENKESIIDAYSWYSRFCKFGGNLQHVAAMYVIKSENKHIEPIVNNFFGMLCSGEDIHAGMPVYAARNAILSYKSKGRKSNWYSAFYTIIRAWSAEISGERLSSIRPGIATVENIVSMKIKKEA